MTFSVLAIETNSASRLLLHSALLFGRKIYGFRRLDSPLPHELSPASYHSLRLLVSSPHRLASSTSAVGIFCFHRKALIWQTGARRVSPVLIASTVEYEMLRVEDTEEGRGPKGYLYRRRREGETTRRVERRAIHDVACASYYRGSNLSYLYLSRTFIALPTYTNL